MKPRRLALDYAAAPPRRGWIGMVLLVAALAAAADAVSRYREVVEERARLQARLELLDTSRRPARAVATGRGQDEARDIATVARRLAVPWAEIIEAVESSASRQVALQQLQPEPERRALRLAAEAESTEAMLDYVRRLDGSGALAGAHLLSHQVRRENAARPIQFVAQAALKDVK